MEKYYVWEEGSLFWRAPAKHAGDMGSKENIGASSLEEAVEKTVSEKGVKAQGIEWYYPKEERPWALIEPTFRKWRKIETSAIPEGMLDPEEVIPETSTLVEDTPLAREILERYFRRGQWDGPQRATEEAFPFESALLRRAYGYLLEGNPFGAERILHFYREMDKANPVMKKIHYHVMEVVGTVAEAGFRAMIAEGFENQNTRWERARSAQTRYVVLLEAALAS